MVGSQMEVSSRYGPERGQEEVKIKSIHIENKNCEPSHPFTTVKVSKKKNEGYLHT